MRRSGFTLVEVLLATVILAFGLMSLMAGLSSCAAMMTLAKEYQDAQYVFSLGELKYPMVESTEVEDELPVDPDSDLVEGYVFERTVDEKDLGTNEVDDGLYVVRTRVSWGSGDDQYEELVRYVRQLKGESEKKK
jgi:prepilin-type N-terminal cleavage/methylation domain-containing protein